MLLIFILFDCFILFIKLLIIVDLICEFFFFFRYYWFIFINVGMKFIKNNMFFYLNIYFLLFVKNSKFYNICYEFKI